MVKSRTLAMSLVFFGGIWLYSGAASANENVVGRPRPGVAISEQDSTAAQVQTQRTLTDPGMLSEKIRAVMGVRRPPGPFAPFALPAEPRDGQSHPFTTKNASSDGGIRSR